MIFNGLPGYRTDDLDVHLLTTILQMARSKELIPGIGRYSRSEVAARRGLYKGQKKSEKPAAAEVPAYQVRSNLLVEGTKN